MSQDSVVGTPQYQVECRKPLFFDNFADGVADSTDWKEDAGNWTIETQTQYDGTSGYVYVQDNTGASYLSQTIDVENWTDHYAVVAFNIQTASGSVGLVFRSDGTNYYAFKITQGSSNNLKLEKEDGTQIGSLGSATIAADTWYFARIRCSGTQIYCDISTDFLTFTNYIDETDSSYTEGMSGVKTYSTEAYFDDMEVYELQSSFTQATNTDMVNCQIKPTTKSKADVFSMQLQNVGGTNTSLYQAGYEMHIWAGYAENSPTLNKLFVGTIEEPIPTMDYASGDTLPISGSDYMNELMGNPVTEVYYSKDVDWIVKDLIAKYCEHIKAGANVQATSNTLTRIAFRHKPLIECLRELAVEGDGTNEYTFWIDTRRELFFKQIGTIDSGKTLSVGTNIIANNFGKNITGTYSKVRVYGKGKPDTNNVVQQTTSNDTIGIGEQTTNQKIFQSFILNASQFFDCVVKPAANTGTPETDLVFELQETSGGDPTGRVLAQYIVRKADWDQAISDATDYTVPLDADITPGDTYAVVVYTKESILDDSNHFNISINNAGGYANGTLKYYDGSWNDTSDDLYFKFYPRLPNVWEQENEDTKKDHRINRTYEDFEKLEEIRTEEELLVRLQTIYEQKTVVPYEGSIVTTGLDDVRAGETITVSIPNAGISDSYEIIELTHTIDKQGYMSTVYLNTEMETLTDVVSDHEKRIRQLEVRELTLDERQTQIKTLQETVTVDNSPADNLAAYDRDINTTDTWFFGKPHTFDEPIKFGGGSGKYGSNVLSGYSA